MSTLLALVATVLTSFLPILNKRILRDARPALMVVLLTPGALLTSDREGSSAPMTRCSGLRAHPRALALAILIAGVAPLFGFTAIAFGLVGYVTALLKLSAVFTIIWARLFLGESSFRPRLLGTLVMLVGGMLVAV